MAGTGEIFDKRVYNTYPYIVLQKDMYNAHLGENLNLFANVYQKDNLFGDKLPLNLAGLIINFRVYDESSNLVAKSKSMITNFETSEINAIIDPFFIKSSGIYYGYFTFLDLDSTSFSLPTPNSITRIKMQFN